MLKKEMISQTIFSGNYSPNRIDSVVFLPNHRNIDLFEGFDITRFDITSQNYYGFINNESKILTSQNNDFGNGGSHDSVFYKDPNFYLTATNATFGDKNFSKNVLDTFDYLEKSKGIQQYIGQRSIDLAWNATIGQMSYDYYRWTSKLYEGPLELNLNNYLQYNLLETAYSNAYGFGNDISVSLLKGAQDVKASGFTFEKVANSAGNIVTSIDISMRAKEVYKVYKAGGDWTYELDKQFFSFATGNLVAAGSAGIVGGIAAVIFGASNPIGWTLAAGAYIGSGIFVDDYVKENFNEQTNNALKEGDTLKAYKSLYDQKDPIIIDLSGNEIIDIIALPESRVMFDMDVDGLTQHTSWFGPGDGMLVLDKNDNGKIDDISEIFSEHFDPRARSAMEALALLDSNLDGKITSVDNRFDEIKVWIDADSDGMTDAGELKTLAELDITEIDLDTVEVMIEDEFGNVRQVRTSATVDGEEVTTEEIALLVNKSGIAFDRIEDGLTYYKALDGTFLAINHSNNAITINITEKNILTYIGGNGADAITATGEQSVLLNGGAGNDILTGGDASDYLFGDGGADELRGGAGDDFLFIDGSDTVIDGGDGWDTVVLEDDEGMSFDTSAHAGIEAVIGSDGNDTITTTGNHAIGVSAGEGNDTITGANGDDRLEGEAGNDAITGGSGLDSAIFTGKRDDFTVTDNGNGTWTVEDLRTDPVFDLGTDTLSGIERIVFNDEVIHTDDTNNAPIVTGGEMTVRGNRTLSLSAQELLNTATDKDGDYLKIASIGNVVGGSASIDKDGNVVFTPLENFTGTASFDYTVEDGHDGRSTGTAKIEILPDLPTDTHFEDQWYLYAANIIPVWDDYTGAGVTVGIVDDGITEHADLNIDLETDLVKMDYTTEAESFLGDSGKHGTFLAGLIGGVKNGEGIVGVAHGSDIKAYVAYGEKAFDRQSEVDISSNSWMYNPGSGPTIYSGQVFGHLSPELEDAAENGRDGLGTIIVASAGNARTSGENTNYYELTNSRYAITVGAVDSLGMYTPFSTQGANILIVAPGTDITSTDVEGEDGYSDDVGNTTVLGADYYNGQGNSFSAPIVSGVVALMLEANADLGWRDVKEILAYSAVNTNLSYSGWYANAAGNWNGGGLHYSHDYGFGMVDALAAVRLAETWTGQVSTSENEITISAESTIAQTVLNNEEGIISQVEITSGVIIDQVEVEIDMQDTDLRDLEITLISPDGTHSILIDNPSMQGAGVVKWTLSSNHFLGENGVGIWSLKVVDKDSGDKAVLKSWKLHLYGSDISNDNVYVYTDEFGQFSEKAYETRGVLKDESGIDTINASAVTLDTSIDLREGEKSLIAGAELRMDSGTIIENVYTGDGDDILTGNDDNNKLYGGRGDDLLTGNQGGDLLDGGKGNDIASYIDSNAAITINLQDGTAHGGDGEGDTLVNIENIIGTDYHDSITGNDLANLLAGGDGNDVLVGGDGDDELVGGEGNDTLLGGEGNDILFAGAGTNTADGGSDRDILVLDGLRSEYTLGASTITHVVSGIVNTLSNIEIVRFSDLDIAWGGNNAPTISGPISLTTDEDGPLTITVASLLGNVTDANSDPLTFTGVGKASGGIVALAANGNITFTPDKDYEGEASFEFTVSDNKAGVATGTVQIAVDGINDVPSARNSMISAPSNTAVLEGVLTASDIDDDREDLTFALDDDAANGHVVVNSDGSYTYTPNEGYTGTDEFSFTVQDPSDAIGTGKVYVEVKAEPQINETFELNAIPRTIASETLSNIVRPTVTSLVTGGFIAAWTSPADGDGFGVYARRFDAGGNPAGEEMLVNTTTEDDQIQPHIVAMADGGFIVTWTSQDQDGSFEGIYAQRYDANGNQVGDETLINTTTYASQQVPATEGLVDGSFVVVWQSFSQDGDDYGIFAKKYHPNGSVSKEEFQVNEYTPDKQSLAQVKATPDGGFIIVWESENQDGDNVGVYGQRFDRFANKIGEEFRINDGVDYGQARPDIAVLKDGSFVVTWLDGDEDPSPASGFDITMRHFDALGEPISDEIRVNSDNYLGLQQYATVTALPNGGYVVVWESHTGSYNQSTGKYSVGSSGAIYAQIYDKYDNAVGSKVTIENFAQSYSWRPEVTAFDNGGYSVVWQNKDSNGEVNMFSKIVAPAITTTYAPMYLVGTSGDDTQIAGDANDSLYGGAGNDSLNGGGGEDTAVYWKSRNQYEIKQNIDGSWSVTNKDGGVEGVDILHDIEQIAFADQTLSIGTQSAADDDTLIVKEDRPLLIDAGIPGATAESAIELGEAAHGTVVLNDDLTITYVPDQNFNGSDSFILTVSSVPKTINITVSAVNDAPILTVDRAETDINVSVNIDVLAGASDTDGDVLSITQFSNPKNGSLQIVSGILQYTPDTDFRGFEVFEYTVSDGQGGNVTKSVMVNVGRADIAAELENAQYNIDEVFNYDFSANAFITLMADVFYAGNVGSVGTLSYSATLVDGSPLPSWLVFDANNLIFSGTPTTEFVDGLNITITATNGSKTIKSEVEFTSNAILGDTGKDVLEGTSANNYIFGDIGDDELSGQAGNDYLDGGSGNDILKGGEGNDTLAGGLGSDILKGDEGDDSIDGGNNIDELNFEDAEKGVFVDLESGYSLGGDTGHDEIRNVENVVGTTKDDFIIGDSGNNILFGGTGNDTLKGGAGNDTLFSDDGEDKLYGEAGNDVLMASDDAQLLDGGDGIDEVNYAHYFNEGGVYVNLSTGLGYLNESKGDQYLNIENAVGTKADDVLIGDSGDNILRGLDGNDHLIGGAGNDTLIGDTGYNTMTGGDGDDVFVIPASPGSTTYITDFTPDDDKIDYSVFNLQSLNGELTLNKRGNDTYIHFNNQYQVILKDVLPSELSLSDFIFSANSQITSLNVVNSYDVTGVTLNGDGENNNLYGTERNDTISGGDGADTIIGLGGDDTLNGGDGDDVIGGNSGTDSINGGAGNDRVDYQDSYAGVQIDLLNSTASGGSAQGDTLTSIEYVTGSKFDDTLTGDGGFNILSGREGDDVINGKGGDNQYSGGEGNDTFVIEWNPGTITTITDFEATNHNEKLDLSNITIAQLYVVREPNGTGIVVVSGSQQIQDILLLDTDYADVTADSFILPSGFNASSIIWQVNGDSGDDVLIGSDRTEFLNTNAGQDAVAGRGGDDTITLNSYKPGLADMDWTMSASQIADLRDTQVILVEKKAGAFDIINNFESFRYANVFFDFFQTPVFSPVNAMFAHSQNGYTISIIGSYNTILDFSNFADIRSAGDIAFYNVDTNINGIPDTTYLVLPDNQQIALANFTDNTVAGTTWQWVGGGRTTHTLPAVGGGTTTEDGWLAEGKVQWLDKTGGIIYYDGVLDGTDRDDILEGGSGVDEINGGGGDDTLTGEGDDDTLNAHEGDDSLDGGSGNDTLSGGSGKDVLDGGAGDDTLVGGDQADTFIIGQESGATDTISDFEYWNPDEKLDLTAFDGDFSNFAALKAAMSEVDGDVHVNLGGGQTLILEDARISDISRENFIGDASINSAPTLEETADDEDILPMLEWNFALPENLFDDADGDRLQITATLANGSPLPSWMAFNAQTMSFFGNPALEDLGVYEVKLTASDGSASVNTSFEVLVDSKYVATNLGQIVHYTEDQAEAFTPIVISSATETTGSVTLTLSNPMAGSLNTGTSNAVSSTFVDGVWEASGNIADINILLATLTFTPAANFNENITVNVSISDGSSTDIETFLSIVGTAVNDAPVAVNDTFETDSGTPINIDVRTNDTDVDQDVLEVQSVTQGSFGAVVINLDGTITYTPDSGYSGSDSFTYEVSDGKGGVNTGTVLIAVAATIGNDLFIATSGNDSFNGLDGADTVTYANASAGVTVNLTETTAQATGGSGSDILLNMENVVGSSYSDILVGNNTNNILYGGNGDDIIAGGVGNDTLEGGIGGDTYYFTSGTDTINETGGSDILEIDVGVTDPGQVSFLRFTSALGDLTVHITNVAETEVLGDIKVTGHFLHANNQVEQIRYAPGWGLADLTQTRVYTISDTVMNDVIYGVDYYLSGGAAHEDDTFFGNIANDYIASGAGADTIFAGDGDDIIYGGDDIDQIVAEGGNDILNGGSGDDWLYGDSGNDQLDGDIGNDYAIGGIGDDAYIYVSGVDVLFEEGGSDILKITGSTTINDITVSDFSDADTKITINSGVNEIRIAYQRFHSDNAIEMISFEDGFYTTLTNYSSWTTGDGTGNTFAGTSGSDTIIGKAGGDTLSGAAGNDYIHGGSDADYIYGGAGDDVLHGGSEGDFLYGQDDADIIFGGAGADWMEGGNGADVIRGGDGDDSLLGQDGNDILYGDAGADGFIGGNGADTFAFLQSSAFSAVDTIYDFNLTDGDKINIADVIQGFDPLNDLITDFVEITTSGSNSIFKVDVDGGANNFVQIATIIGVTGLTDEAALVTSGNLIVT